MRHPMIMTGKNKIQIGIGVITIIFSLFSGCVSMHPSATPAEKTNHQMAGNANHPKSPIPPPELPPKVVSDGSLWKNESMLNHLFITPKPRNVGDIVTIKIVESASASNNAKTNTGRKSSLSANIDKLLGLENKYTNSKNPKFDEFPNWNPFGKIEGGMASKFDGSGATKRSGDLTAFVTARIAHVFPNGDFYITGSREITVNYEKQLINLTGIIRPDDIDSNNIILSTYISDAKIVYNGAGVIQKRQKPGWLANVINTIWPF